MPKERLAELQYHVFGAQLNEEEIQGLTRLATSEDAPVGTGRPDDVRKGIDESEWLRLMRIFIERGRVENVWRILRYYGYNGDLVLDPKYLNPKLELRGDGSEVVELSEEGWSFVDEVFDAYSEVG